MRKINLVNRAGEAVDYALVDDEDYGRLAKWDWHLRRIRNRVYAARYLWNGGRPKKVYMHREILTKAAVVDHINGNGLDNTKGNLRACTHRQNLLNRGKAAHNTSGFKGVSLAKDKAAKGFKKVWAAYIAINGKRTYLGCHETPELAHRAYVAAAKKLHGEFAHA